MPGSMLMSKSGLRIKALYLRQGIRRHLWEVILLAAVYFVYMFVRKFMIPNIEPGAFENAVKLASFEFATGLLWEPVWQGWTIEHSKALVIFLNWVYVITFFPIIAITAVLVYIKDRPKYFYYRNLILLSFVIALLLFALFPLAPPRFLPEHGFIDSIQRFGPSWYGGSDMAAAIYYNEYAAMPSLHFGWTVLFGVLFFRMGPKWLKVLGVIYPTMTFFAITLTGNHFILDAVGGAAVALASFLGYECFLRLRPYFRPSLAFAKSSMCRAAALTHGTLLRLKADTLLALAVMKSLYEGGGSIGWEMEGRFPHLQVLGKAEADLRTGSCSIGHQPRWRQGEEHEHQ